MNLICFPHYTCGGLLCDIFSNTFSMVSSNGGLDGINHSLGKIGDADSIFDNYDVTLINEKIDNLELDNDTYIGTHCWPGRMDLTKFNRVIVVSTATHRSRIYRWVRAYHHYYSKSAPWLCRNGQERIDKERETSKNYLLPFIPVTADNVINIEFADVVETTSEFHQLTIGHNVLQHMQRWQEINNFLYTTDLWNSVAVRRFYEAELEQTHNRYYHYD